MLDGYLLCVMGTVLISALLTAILPEGKTSASVKGVAKLACLLTIISPIPKLLRYEQTIAGTSAENTDKFFEKTVIQTDGAFIKYYSQMCVGQTETFLEDKLTEKYGAQTEIVLEWSLDSVTEAKIKVEKIRVRLEESLTEEVKAQMYEYLTKNYCSEVLIE